MKTSRRDFIKTGSAVAAAGFGGFAHGAGAGKLALFGGTPVISAKEAVSAPIEKLFHWPIVNDAMRRANDAVLVKGKMSKTDIAREFEEKFAAWNGLKYAVSTPNGTSALNAAFYAIGLGPGDELICPSITYWASCLGAIHLGASVVFADVKADDATLDPASFEAHITPRTKAVVPVHAYGSPCDMDAIMAIAKKHGIKVVEDVSHAQGGLYKGRKLGTFGDVAAMSLMSCKSFAIGEGGMLVTNDREIFRRAIRWGSYERIGEQFSKEEIRRTRNLPFGGVKNRLNQCAAAVGLEQLKKYDAEIAEIEKAMLYYHKGIADVKGIRMVYPKYPKSNKAGWYASHAYYDPEAFGGIPVSVFAEALRYEIGGDYETYYAGCNFPLHWSSVFDDEDIFSNGKPPSRRFLPAGVSPKAESGSLPVADSVNPHCLSDPWFKHYDTALIDRYVEAVHKVAANCAELKRYDGPAKYGFWE